MTIVSAKRFAVAATAMGVLACGTLSALGFPEPHIVPQSWQLDLTYQTPRLISIEGIGGRPQWFWYMTYKVVNNTGRERLFIPEVTIATDAGDIISAGTDVPATVFTAIRQKLDNPLLESSIDVVGKLLQGEDLAKETVAIWPAFDHDVDQVNIFITGVSGETAIIQHPRTGETLTLRKTLMLRYATPGTDVPPRDQDIQPAGEQWVMR